MSKTFLITDYGTPLSRKLAAMLSDRGHKVITADTSEGEQDENTPQRANYSWNQRSPLGALNLMQQVLNNQKELDEVIVIITPSVENRPVHQLPTAVIEETVDTRLKGHFFLLKELLLYFQDRDHGVINLVFFTDGTEVLPPLDAAVYGGLKEGAASLFKQYQEENLVLCGFQSSTGSVDDFSEYILKNILDKPRNMHGRWFMDKQGLLGSISSRKR